MRTNPILTPSKVRYISFQRNLQLKFHLSSYKVCLMALGFCLFCCRAFPIFKGLFRIARGFPEKIRCERRKVIQVK